MACSHGRNDFEGIIKFYLKAMTSIYVETLFITTFLVVANSVVTVAAELNEGGMYPDSRIWVCLSYEVAQDR